MAKHTLKILRYEHRKICKICLAIFDMIHERIKIKQFNQKNIHGHLTQRKLHVLSKQEMYFNPLTPSVYKKATYISGLL